MSSSTPTTLEDEMERQFNMPLLGDDFRELEVQTTHGPMSIPGNPLEK